MVVVLMDLVRNCTLYWIYHVSWTLSATRLNLLVLWESSRCNLASPLPKSASWANADFPTLHYKCKHCTTYIILCCFWHVINPKSLQSCLEWDLHLKVVTFLQLTSYHEITADADWPLGCVTWTIPLLGSNLLLIWSPVHLQMPASCPVSAS